MAKDSSENLTVITSPEGEVWEEMLEATEKRLLRTKIALEVDEYAMGLMKKKCEEHSINLEE